MDTLNICWRGLPGVGKRLALQARLAEVAASRGLPFHITSRPLAASAPAGEDASADGDESGGGGDGPVGQIMAETSLVHMGFDIARMSMKDKQVLIPILNGLGAGSQVLSGSAGRGCRILVLYHAHLLSSESVLLIQSCLEMTEGDVSIWMTSELPVNMRIRDWFVEIPVANKEDRAFAAYKQAVTPQNSAVTTVADWPDIFYALLRKWAAAGPPTIEDVKEVKAFVYELLMRNLRWVEATHFLLDVLITSNDITDEQRFRCIQALAKCEATAGGFTIPSYRIPILWESLFLAIRDVVHRPVA
jgi:hypothetical protein